MKKTILLADDSVTIRKVVELTLMDEAYKLISVGSGDEAVERLQSEIDLVIADVHMPGVDGYGVCRAFKEQDRTTPVLLLVGTFEPYDPEKAEAAGADDHLKKPFDSQDLLSRVRGLLAGATGVEDSTEPVEPSSAEDSFEASADALLGDPAIPVGTSIGGEPALASEQASPTPPAAKEAEEAVEGGPDAGQSEHAVAAATADSTGGLREEDDGSGASVPVELSDETVDRIARRVIELLSEEAVREVAWDVIPDLAEVVIKERLNELESQVD